MTEEISLVACLSRWARETPDRTAITAPDGLLTWAQLHSRSNRLARSLARHGVFFGDFVTVSLPNSRRFFEACLACWKLGAVPQLTSPKLHPAEFSAIVSLADSKAILADDTLTTDHAILSVEDLIRAEDDDGDLPAVISPAWKAPTSGGSIGWPKLIVSGTPAVIDSRAADFWRLSETDVALIPAPLYHNAPFGCAIAALIAGAHVVVLSKFEPASTLTTIEHEQVTWLYLVPTMMHRIWRLPDNERLARDMSSVRTIWHMAAPCPPWLKEAWIGWFGPDAIWELYAGTEAQAATVISGTEWLHHRGSVGRPFVGEMRAFHQDGEPVPTGEPGEIYMRCSAGMPDTYRYVGAEPRTLGDWESLGDMGWFDRDGYLYLADRRSDMVIVGGVKAESDDVGLTFAAEAVTPACVAQVVLGALEKRRVEVFMPPEYAHRVRTVGTNPRLLRRMIDQAEEVGLRNLKKRRAKKA